MAAAKNIDWDRVPLGAAADRQIANALGVTEQAVQHARAKRGIPAWQPPPRERRVSFTVSVPVPLMDAIEAAAANTGSSRNEVINQILRSWQEVEQ